MNSLVYMPKTFLVGGGGVAVKATVSECDVTYLMFACVSVCVHLCVHAHVCTTAYVCVPVVYSIAGYGRVME